MIRAVIFDLDGVIVDSEDAHVEAEKQAFLEFGVAVSTEELQRYAGTTAKTMFTDLIRKHQLKTTFQEMVKIKEQSFFNLLDEDAEPIKGVIDLIQALKKAKVKLAIASSSNRKWVEYILTKLQITRFFDCFMGAEDIRQGKPNPEIYLKVARALDTRPEECVVIEDAELGVQAAKRAGMKTIGYRNPRSGNQNLSEADVVIDDFSTLDISGFLS